MNSLFYICLMASHFTTGLFLLDGISGWRQVIEFLIMHAMAIFLTYSICMGVLGTNKTLRQRVLTRGFMYFFLAVAVIPIIGPLAVTFLIFFLRFYPLNPIHTELYSNVDRDIMWVIQKKVEEATIPVIESLLTSGLNREDSLKLIMFMEEIDWSVAKTQILKYLIRLSSYSNVTYMAIDMLDKKMDHILSEIARLESEEDRDMEMLGRLANYYHEICYLDLCEPAMQFLYMEKACCWAIQAFEKDGNEENALLAFKFLLEADRLEDAGRILGDIKAKEHDVVKWLPYEIEMAVKRYDKDNFDLIVNVVDYGGGVYIPERLKNAVNAWRKALTSAWL